jgi:hypothetical protein
VSKWKWKGETILERVRGGVAIDEITGCWLWRGWLSSKGYSRLRDGAKFVYGHRALWIELHGPLSAGQCVCHRCDVPRCVNPEHLFVGSNADNHADKIAKGRQARGEGIAQAKLTAQQVLAIRAHPGRQASIAAVYGINQTQVSQIKRRVKWAHLEETTD